MRKILSFALLLLSFQVKAQWQQTSGPEGAESRTLFRYANSIYYGTFDAGYFVSSDNGSSWNMGNPYFQATTVDHFASNSSWLYLSSPDSGIYKSSDNGLTWTSIVANLPDFGYYNVKSMVATDSLIGISYFNTIYVSSDNGNSWTAATGVTGGYLTTSGNKILLIGGGPSVYSSTDMLSWTPVSTPPPMTVSIFAASDSLVVIGSWGYGIAVSRDLAATWQQVSLPGDTLINTLVVAHDTIIVSGRNGIYTSFDKGYSWILDTGIDNNQATVLLSSSEIIAGNSLTGIKKRNIIAVGWNDSNTGLIGSWTDDLYTTGDALIVKNRYKRLSTIDGGATWSPCDSIISGALKVYRQGLLILAFYYNHLERSTDGGNSWQQITLTGIGEIRSVAFYNNLYIATVNGPYYSPDLGLSWFSIRGNLPSNPYSLQGTTIYAENNLLLLGTQSGFFRSSDNGTSWNQVIFLFGYYMGPVTRIVRSGEYLIAAAAGVQGGIMCSGDSFGWTDITPTSSAHSIADIEAIGNSLVAVDYFEGCFISHNNGSSWARDNNGLFYYRLTGVEVLGNQFFISTYGHGVFKRTFSDLGVIGIAEQHFSPESSIYPNPVIDQLRLLNPDPEGEFIEIYTMSGREVFRGSLKCNNTINVSGLAPAAYIIQTNHSRSVFIKQ